MIDNKLDGWKHARVRIQNIYINYIFYNQRQKMLRFDSKKNLIRFFCAYSLCGQMTKLCPNDDDDDDEMDQVNHKKQTHRKFPILNDTIEK